MGDAAGPALPAKDSRKLIGAGAPVSGVLTFAWHYQDQPLMAHFTVIATGPGGRAEQSPFTSFTRDSDARP